MAALRDPEAAVFLVGILASGRKELAVASEALADRFGVACFGSRTWDFANTGYYRDELGPRPIRAFLVFPGLFPTSAIAGRKLITNAMEKELAHRLGGAWPRPVNLDPGYLTLAKLVLASAKNYAHRIHVADRIYAEVTLQYRQGAWRRLPWTFPDYASGEYDGFLSDVRNRLARSGENPGSFGLSCFSLCQSVYCVLFHGVA